MSSPVDFFIHIPKTAGSTMSQIIESQYPKGTVLDLREPAIGAEELTRKATDIAPEVRIVTGHLHYGYAQLFGRDCRPFTMLRDPTERMISLYYYLAREPTHPRHEAFKRGEVSFEKIARRHGRGQTSMIAGLPQKNSVPDDELLNRAKDILEKIILCVGLTERFDESLLLYNRVLGWNVSSYVRENVTKNRPTRDSLPPSDIATIRECSRVDQQLYDFSKTLFEKHISGMPATFAEELAALRRNVKVARGVSWIGKNIRRVKSALKLN